MRAIILKSFGGTDQLEEKDVPMPSIKDNEVLIRARAIGLNPVDVKTRKGKGQAAKLKLENPMILGWDVSGEIIEVGGAVKRFKKGDSVFGMINLPGTGKTYAEYVAAPEEHIALKPDNVSHEEAAAASLAAMTAWQALVDKAELKAGQKILVHAAAGGVGHYAVQIAIHIGAYVIGTSSAQNKEMVLSLGANEHIDYKSVKFEEVSPMVDVVLDTIGGENITRSLKVLKPGGTIVALPSGVSETVTQDAASQNKKGVFFLVQSNASDMKQIASLLNAGRLRSHLSGIFSFSNIKEAHDMLESGKTVGKIVLMP
ncbi:MAG: NADP-dependent oxidoreductase [Chitinophagaceae bacterium]|nr:NADP-dependent oxidoreductase [Chitinophagaceae bacterium]